MIINIISSIILGFIISYFFATYILFDNEKLKGPNSNHVRKEIYIDDNKNCFSFIPVPYICPTSI